MVSIIFLQYVKDVTQSETNEPTFH